MRAFAIGILSPLMAFYSYLYPSLFSTPFFFILGGVFVCIFLTYFFIKKPLMLKRIISFTLIVLFLGTYFCFTQKNDKAIPLTTEQIGTINDFSIKPKQWRISINTPNNGLVLGIYYPHSTSAPNSNLENNKNDKEKSIKEFKGKITLIRQTKTQTQITLVNKTDKILGVYYKSKKALPLPTIKIGNFAIITSSLPKNFTMVDPHKKGQKTKAKKGYTYFGKISFLTIIKSLDSTNELLPLLSNIVNTTPLPSFRMGQKVKLVPFNTFKPVRFLEYPKYLFAQGYKYFGRISNIEILNPKPVLSFTQKIKVKLIDFYTNSKYAGFYNAVFMAKKDMNKSIYILFQKNDVVPFLVISGLHIDIIISFLLFSISFLFTIPTFFKTNPLKNFAKREIHFFDIRHKSLPIFLVITVILLFYLTIIGFPQSATRAVFMFLLAGTFYHLGLKTTRIALLMFCVFIIFLLFPYWVAYPLGFIYSTLAVFAIYFTLPLIFSVTPKDIGAVNSFLRQSLLLGIFISFFMIPLSFYMFHYYNLFSILVNIPLSLLFFVFIYVGILASLLFFIFPFGALLLLKIGDSLIFLMLKLLTICSKVTLFKVFIHHPPNFINLLVIYLVIFCIIFGIKKWLKVRDLML